MRTLIESFQRDTMLFALDSIPDKDFTDILIHITGVIAQTKSEIAIISSKFKGELKSYVTYSVHERFLR